MVRAIFTQNTPENRVLAAAWEDLGAVDRYRALFQAARLGRECALLAGDPDFLPGEDYYVDRLCDLFERAGVELTQAMVPPGPRLTAFREGWNEGLKAFAQKRNGDVLVNF